MNPVTPFPLYRAAQHNAAPNTAAIYRAHHLLAHRPAATAMRVARAPVAPPTITPPPVADANVAFGTTTTWFAARVSQPALDLIALLGATALVAVAVAYVAPRSPPQHVRSHR